jgi:hypothetical protein
MLYPKILLQLSNVSQCDQDKYVVIHLVIMPDKHQDHYDRKIFLLVISAVVIMSSFAVGSQFVQLSLAQNLIQQGQLACFNETGNQTANQSALLGDPAKMYVPSQPAD